MPAAKRTTDHQVIRRWVEQHGGHPATVKRTRKAGDAGLIRIDFPGFSGEGSLEPISWDEWFERFDSQNLAFLYQEGKNTNFNKLVRRDPEEERPSDATDGNARNTRGGRPRRVASARGRRNASARGRSSSASASGASRTRSGSGRRKTGAPRAESGAATESAAARGSSGGAGSRSSRGRSGAARGTKRSTTRASGRQASASARGRRSGASGSARGRGGDLQQWTKAELLERARSVGLPQRSGMNKAELVRALQNRM